MDDEGGFERVTMRERGFAFAFSSLRTVVRAVLVARRVCHDAFISRREGEKTGKQTGMFEAMMEKIQGSSERSGRPTTGSKRLSSFRFWCRHPSTSANKHKHLNAGRVKARGQNR